MSTVSISKDSFKASRKFYDDHNYPRGMSRSGDFTLQEVQILETYGVAFKELTNGTREPVTDEEQRFVDVCQGKELAESKLEKTWLKYQNKVLSPKQFHTLFGRTKVEASDDDTNSSDAEPIEIDTE
ncbi:DUF413 domain-containing protein [Thalassotalea euphylliae]|uniref:DUF413 domain-containing protein n=1 Tax=Thalassotalea euphylliae TaxID=1655234 RepID=UPI00362ADC22